MVESSMLQNESRAFIITITCDLRPKHDNATNYRTKLVRKVSHICDVTWIPVKGIQDEVWIAQENTAMIFHTETIFLALHLNTVPNITGIHCKLSIIFQSGAAKYFIHFPFHAVLHFFEMLIAILEYYSCPRRLCTLPLDLVNQMSRVFTYHIVLSFEKLQDCNVTCQLNSQVSFSNGSNFDKVLMASILIR